MKREYVKPSMIGEMFAANEYCATCGATGEKVYKFICDAPDGDVFYYNGTQKVELGGYHDCGERHTVTVTSDEDLPFYDGFVDRNNNNKEDEGEGAIIWVERYKYSGRIYDWHASHAYSSITDIEVDRS